VKYFSYFFLVIFLIASCSEKENNAPASSAITVNVISADNFSGPSVNNVSLDPDLRIRFSTPVKRTSTSGFISLYNAGIPVPVTLDFAAMDSVVIINTSANLAPLTRYNIVIQSGLEAANGTSLQNSANFSFLTKMDSTDKFPVISDNALLDKVQQQTFKYFWDFGHPVSGMSRERNTSGDLVTSGGTGFGIMAMIAAVGLAASVGLVWQRRDAELQPQS